ncbi:glycoside hydrolase family 17 protein [Cylindrobasidium torrendii FP15055 ss-10]|uniref:glucan endo-1,3-beta-D-glucosidase n=1 Tax=Cylindrobasidium torrendii FP15055 ss-10 TaxID=1314674 RepID=A0A0D7B313_9AGAR|nr:glycoside hydrolase family 17 protein [Cylindrobasidium torrendii FP15055 ss-10]
MSTPYRDSPQPSHTDLQDYYDTVPPPHRLSSYNSQSPAYSDSIPMTSPRTYGNAPLHADSRTNLSADQDSHDTGAAAFGAGAAGGAAAYGARQGQNTYNSNSGMAAQNSDWMEKGTQSGGSGKRKWIIIGGLVGLLAIIIVGVALGVTLSKKSSSTTSGSSSSSSSDPSSFELDSDLHKSFYGIAYTPYGSQYPDCGNSLEDIIKDIQIMSQLTTRVRLYGADCNQSALVLEAIKQTKVNMTVYLGNYPSATDNDVAYERQRDVLKEALQTYGTDNVAGITVGNEYILNYMTSASATDVNGAAANKGAEALIANINDTRSMLSDMSITNVPVGNADAGAYFNNLVLESIDYGMANVHAWFAGTTIEDAAGWTWDFFQVNDVDLSDATTNKPPMSIAETGWPTKSSSTEAETNGAAAASVANLNTFLDTFVCQANKNGTEYFFFEFYDEKWKDDQFGGVEGWWGIFNANRTLKAGLTIPNCVL